MPILELREVINFPSLNDETRQINVGALSRMYIDEQNYLGLGTWWSDRAAVMSLEYVYENLVIGVSYDIPLQQQTRGNSIEFVVGVRKAF